MILSKRERYVAVIAVAALAVLVLDHYALTPLLDRRARMQTDGQRVRDEMERAAVLFARQGRMSRTWNEMLEGGLNEGPAEMESAMLHALRDWAQETGLTLASVKPQRLAQTGDLREIEFDAVGTGPMRAVAQFLWRVEGTQLPLRIKGLQLGSRKEGADDLSLTLKISTLYLANVATLPPRTEPTQAPGGNNR